MTKEKKKMNPGEKCVYNGEGCLHAKRVQQLRLRGMNVEMLAFCRNCKIDDVARQAKIIAKIIADLLTKAVNERC